MGTFVGMRSWRVLVAWAVAAVALLVVVPGSPAAAAPRQVSLPAPNNTGISQGPTSNSNFDGGGFSYSSVALRLAGVAPGQAITSDGLTYTWPATDIGAKDNLVPNGQTVPIPDAAPGATLLGFLGASTNGPVNGKFVLNYSTVDAEGNTVQVSVPTTIAFSDWTLNAGGAAPSPGNKTVVTSAFRVSGDLQPEVVETNVFAVTTALDPTMTLESVTLAKAADGQIHLFGMAVK